MNGLHASGSPRLATWPRSGAKGPRLFWPSRHATRCRLLLLGPRSAGARRGLAFALPRGQRTRRTGCRSAVAVRRQPARRQTIVVDGLDDREFKVTRECALRDMRGTVELLCGTRFSTLARHWPRSAMRGWRTLDCRSRTESRSMRRRMVPVFGRLSHHLGLVARQGTHAQQGRVRRCLALLRS
jgi:hypothetical protein